jgi:tRNA threonylcarbamoyladenosine biosynthesis protein TsaE
LITLAKKTYKSQSPEDTYRIAAETLDKHPGRLIIALSGDLGSGKTVFVQGLALALGSKRAVTSPTFTLLNEYPCIRPLYHADLYRLEKPSEADALGLDDYMEAQAVVAIEWPEKAPQIFPKETVHVEILMQERENERCITVTAP